MDEPPQISMKLGSYIPYQKLLINTHFWPLTLYGFYVTTFQKFSVTP